MLGKLLKYELKSTGRGMVLMWGIVLIFSIATGISGGLMDESGAALTVFVICLCFYVILLIAIIVLLFVNVVKSFYSAMYKEEAYLTHMLPAKPWEQIISRLITSVIWLAASLAVLFLSAMLMGFFVGFFEALASSDVSEIIYSTTGSMTAADITSTIILALISYIRLTLQIYAAVLIGGCAIKHKVIFGFLSYFGINIIMNIIYSFTDVSNSIITYIGSVELETYGSSYAFSWAAYAIEAAFAVIFFFVSKYLLKRRLNLT